MNRKLILILIIAVVVISPIFFISCTPKCPPASENVPGAEGFRENCPIEEALTNQNGPAELNMYVLFDNTDVFQEQLQAFQSQNPNIRVNVSKFVDIQEYENLIINEIAEGKGPDVFMVHNSWLTKHDKKLLPLPLDQPIVMTPSVFRQTFFQAAANDLIIDEQIYGMPLSMDNLAIFYNKVHYNDLLASTNQPGELWENIQEEVAQLTKRDNSPERFGLAGIAMGRADNISSAVDILYALMIQYGTVFYNENEDAAIFADSQGASADGIQNPGLAAFELFTSFALPSYRYYSWNETITGFAPADKEIDPFIRGKVSMIIGYPYLYDRLVQAIQTKQKLGSQHINVNDIAIAPFPQLVSSEQATSRNTYASYFPLVVARTTQYPQQAWSLIQFLTSPEPLATYHKKTNRPTSRLDQVSEQQTDPKFGVFAFQAPFAKSFRIYNDSAYRTVFSQAIQQVANNVASPEQALREAQAKITCVIRKEKDLVEAGTDCGI